MSKSVYYIVVVISFLLFSCSNTQHHRLIKNWKVTKMERMVKVTSSGYTPIQVDIDPKMSFNFTSKDQVQLITQMGSDLRGRWTLKDSTLHIIVQKETKKFQIQELKDSSLILTSGVFKFYLQN